MGSVLSVRAGELFSNKSILEEKKWITQPQLKPPGHDLLSSEHGTKHGRDRAPYSGSPDHRQARCRLSGQLASGRQGHHSAAQDSGDGRTEDEREKRGMQGLVLLQKGPEVKEPAEGRG